MWMTNCARQPTFMTKALEIRRLGYASQHASDTYMVQKIATSQVVLTRDVKWDNRLKLAITAQPQVHFGGGLPSLHSLPSLHTENYAAPKTELVADPPPHATPLAPACSLQLGREMPSKPTARQLRELKHLDAAYKEPTLSGIKMRTQTHAAAAKMEIAWLTASLSDNGEIASTTIGPDVEFDLCMAAVRVTLSPSSKR